MPASAVINLSTAALAPSDAQLLALLQAQDEAAFAVLVARYYDVVYRIVWRLVSGKIDPEDILQDTFFKLWRNPSQIREASALQAWLVRVASNAALDSFRKKSPGELEEADTIADGRPNAETDLRHIQAERRIATSIAGLPERQKLALTLVYFEQMTNIAAAAIMEISVDAIESLLARARRNLKDNLEPDKQELLAVLSEIGE